MPSYLLWNLGGGLKSLSYYDSLPVSNSFSWIKQTGKKVNRNSECLTSWDIPNIPDKQVNSLSSSEEDHPINEACARSDHPVTMQNLNLRNLHRSGHFWAHCFQQHQLEFPNHESLLKVSFIAFVMSLKWLSLPTFHDNDTGQRPCPLGSM